MMKSLKRYKIKSLKYGLLSTALLVPMIMSAPQGASAAVSGQCANCHTMHYSQGATQLGTWGGSGPYSSLLTNDCLGCHTTTGADPLVDSYPYVAGDASFDDDNCLAGGYFTAGGGNNDDNSHTMGSNNLPAGYSGAWYTGVANGFSCAGTNGCHGNHTDLDDMDAISGEHHTGSGAYRMLYVDTAGSNPVAGVPATDYEKALIQNTTYPGSGAIAHNIYSADASSDNTISEFCALCHPNFHGAGTESSGSWIRHPSDVVIPSDWDIGDEANTLTDSDYKRNPVGWAEAAEGTGDRRATCISCHRAHGTANNDLLRWEYSTQVAGGGNSYGCLGCHDKQM